MIDLTEDRGAGTRLDDYREAFGLPSALHEQPLQAQRERRGFERVHALFHRRDRA